ncbi:MAG UNVERIFIED_CONTAM: hypothetical protein LVR29_06575 [Microcystis novacekii LVE1205-3]
MSELKNALQAGKQCWAHLAGLEVGELEEIIALGTRAKEQMIGANLRLVVSVAKKYQNRRFRIIGFDSRGNPWFGMLAVRKFDPTKGYRFSTYAYWWYPSRNYVYAIATQSRIIRLPASYYRKTQQN